MCLYDWNSYIKCYLSKCFEFIISISVLHDDFWFLSHFIHFIEFFCKIADASKKNALSANFLVENYFSLVGSYLCKVWCPGSKGFSIYMWGTILSPPPCKISPKKSPCKIGLNIFLLFCVGQRNIDQIYDLIIYDEG